MATTDIRKHWTNGLGMSKAQKALRTKRVAIAAFKAWRSKTSKLKPALRVPYNAAMRVTTRDTTVTLSLQPTGRTSTLVRSVEYGFGPGGVGTVGPYDMRKTLLRSASAKLGKNGRYLHVPFRVTTRRMKALGGHAAYAAAKRLDASVRNAGSGNTRWGGRLANPSGYANKIHPRARHIRGIGRVPPHATDPLAGLARFAGRRRGSTYGTFRTISEGVKAWVHPGIRARRFIRKVERMLPLIASEVA